MSKIVDNKSNKEILASLEAFNSLLPILKFLDKSRFSDFDKRLTEISESAKSILFLSDDFNVRFADRAWVVYESMPMEAVKESILIFDSKGEAEAENYLVEIYNENYINMQLNRFKGDVFLKKRFRLLSLAKEDYLSERYHACIPLLLSLIDGIVNDVSKNVGFFASQGDLVIDDTIVAHESGLTQLRNIMSKGRNVTNENDITIPYRNGILHGRELNFDNKIVAAKCWACLFSVADWVRVYKNEDIKNNETKNEKFTDIWYEYFKTQKMSKKINDWVPRDSVDYLPVHRDDFDKIPLNTPERAVADFLNNWIKGRWALIVDGLSYLYCCSLGEKIKRAKKEFPSHFPKSYKIISVKDEAPAISMVNVDVCFDSNSDNVKNFAIRLCYQDKNFNLLLRDEPDGKWYIVQNSLYPAFND